MQVETELDSFLLQYTHRQGSAPIALWRKERRELKKKRFFYLLGNAALQLGIAVRIGVGVLVETLTLG